MSTPTRTHTRRPNGKPYRRPGSRPLVRSTSLFGTIKNIVTAPLSWFATHDDFDDPDGGKRRRLPIVVSEGTEQTRNKRMRVDSPDREHRPTQGYLDPPRDLFRNSPAQPHQSQSQPPTSLLASHNRLLPGNVSLRPNASLSRRTLSPLPSTSHAPSGLSRTMSVDLPSQTRPGLSRDATMLVSTLQEQSSAPTAPFRMRTSLTPQPSLEKQRDPSEPPPLSSLIINPKFVRPPSESQHGHGRSLSVQPTLTLGSLVESKKPPRSPLFGSFASDAPRDARAAKPTNAAERALYELDVYKTPLLPTRLRGSSVIPDMFLPPPSSHRSLVLNGKDRSAKKRLGMKDDKKREKAKKETKPYAGQGGMKKLLARRKREEAEAEESKKADDMEDVFIEPEAKEEKEVASLSISIPPLPSQDKFYVLSSASTSSSLRVGRTRVNRNHASRPTKNRFSAIYDEEDEDEKMDGQAEKERKELEEAAKKVPVFEIPAGFSFAKDAPPIGHDLSKAKEPPITSLPFSLSKPSSVASSGASTPYLAPPSIPTLSKEPPAFSFGAPAPAAALPSIALVPPTPESRLTLPAPPAAPESNTIPSQSSVPNFFANSSVLSTHIPMGVVPIKESDNPFRQGDKSQEKEKAPEAPADANKPAHNPSLFGNAASTPALSSVSPSGSMFGNVSSSVVPPTSVSLFGAPPKSAESVKPTEPTLKVETKQEDSVSKPPSLFGPTTSAATTSSAISSGFCAAPSSDAPKAPTFSFSQRTAPAETVAPKPLFSSSSSSISFGPSSTPAVVPAPSDDKNTFKSPFLFGAPPATPPAANEKKSVFVFNTPTPAAPASTSSFSFTPSSNAADISKPFAFGAPPPRPVTPPKNDQEVMMDESPTRDMQTVENKEIPKFSFGNSGSSSSLFAGSSGPGPFSFGAQLSSTTSSNLFGPKLDTKVENKPTTFGGFGTPTAVSPVFPFGQQNKESEQPRPATSFSFGSSEAPEPEAARPSTSGSFSFNQPTPTTSSAPFGFGTTTNTTNINPFGQPGANSTPSSPATFAQPTPFSFSGTPTPTAPNNPFAFSGSQPASPAVTTTNLPLHTPTTPSGGGSSFSFGSSSGAPPPGGTLFTIGAAPAPTPGGPRQIKKLPTRRGGKR